MLCKNCGGTTYRIAGLCLDRDGIREAAYCDRCGTIFKVTASGMTKYKAVSLPSEVEFKDQIINLCETIIKKVKEGGL